MLPAINIPGPLCPLMHRNSYIATQDDTVFTTVGDADHSIVLCGLVFSVTPDATNDIDYRIAFDAADTGNPASLTVNLSGGSAPVVIGCSGGILMIGPPGEDLVITIGALIAGRAWITAFSFVIPRLSLPPS